MRKVMMGVVGVSLLGLAACVQQEPVVVDIPDDMRAEELAFAGTWNCEGARTTIGGLMYQGTPEEKPVEIESVAANDDGTFLMALAGGRQIVVGDLSANKMSLTEHAAQTKFYCKRIK